MTDPLDHPLFTYALERENWELAALLIVTVAAERLGFLPPDTIDSMLEVVADAPVSLRRRGRCRERGR